MEDGRPGGFGEGEDGVEVRHLGELLGALSVTTTDALENLCDLARGIYPPLLADQGLVAALEAKARRAALPVVVEDEGVGRYPQEVETAVYFCCLEALQNIAKYANTSTARVRLADRRGSAGARRAGSRSPLRTRA